MTTAARAQELAEAERLFAEARDMKGLSAPIYTSLMLAYTRSHKADRALEIFREMKREGLQVDTAVYTTLINAFRNERKFVKCWDLYYDCIGGGSSSDPDAILYSSMIKICSYVR